MLSHHLCLAQNNNSYKVIDAYTEEPLVGAAVIAGQLGSYTDSKGFFMLDNRTTEVEISYIGYETINCILQDLLVDDILIKMKPAAALLKTAVVTGSRYENSLERSTVSIDVIKPQFIKSINSVDMEDVMNRVPGVQMIDGQINIRGGAGFSYGAGSRVMLLINDMPALQPDAGLINWSDIPVENIAQVEVLKGAASTLYGSAAMNGIVNIKTGYPTAKPTTEASISYTHFMDPKDPKKVWWDQAPNAKMYSILHKRKIKKLDLVASALVYSLDSYNQFTTQDRSRFTIETRYRHSDRLNYGLNINYNQNENSNFFLWNFRAGYEGLESTVSSGDRQRYTIDPFIHYTDGGGSKHKLKGRYYSVDNNNNLNQSNTSQNYYGEYQFQKEIKNLGLNITTGAVYSTLNTDSALFGDAEFKARNSAAYVQLDEKINENLTMTAGVRYEYNSLTTPDVFLGDTITDVGRRDGAVISRVAANYKVYDYTFLRASWGQGYRFPTIVERYIRTSFSSFEIFPNVNLKPEYGWASEIGIKQGMKLFGFDFFVDASRFWQEYNDMMEFVFYTANGNSGFQAQNIGNTSINGYEINLGGTAHILGIPTTVYGGYTYIDPKYRDFEENEVIRNSLSTDQNVLKYRTKHNFKMDVEVDVKELKIGANVERVSHMINVDTQLEIFNNIGQYRKAFNDGYLLYGARVSYTLKGITVNVLMKNIANVEYTQRPGLLEEPRNVSLRLDYKF